jgi:hypothetical protein
MEFIAGLVIGALLVILFKDKVLTFKIEHTHRNINEYVELPPVKEMSEILKGKPGSTNEDKVYEEMGNVMEEISNVMGGK